MGFLDKLLGTHKPARAPEAAAGNGNDQAIERYRYLLRTAPPDAIEQAHQEAFAQLTPEQRAQVLQQLSSEVAPSERAHLQAEQADPNALARLATRAELRQPGTLERLFGGARFGGGPGMGMGGSFAGSLLTSIAGTFIGTAIAHQFLGGFGDHESHGQNEDSGDQHEAHKDDAEQDQHEYASNDDDLVQLPRRG